jgi:ribosomal protein L37AE/L43A
MQVRDDFPLDVKRTLAARAGHRCSVCSKATSGPGTDQNLALSDGVAAHITAASFRGPRFDPSLTPEQRRSIDNGIWVCTQCGRKIDADTPPFSVEVLRGHKRIREEVAEREPRGCRQPVGAVG